MAIDPVIEPAALRDIGWFASGETSFENIGY
jgi:hypothetical protein